MKSLVLISLLIGTWYASENWKADAAKAKIQFTVKGPFGKVNGTFSGLKATILFDEKNPGSGKIDASIESSTVNTGIGLRNHDLKKEQWLNADKFPVISFHSTNIEKKGKDFEATGELHLKGVTKKITIPFSFTQKDKSGLFKGKFEIDREEFKIGKPGGSVGKLIIINLQVPVNN